MNAILEDLLDTPSIDKGSRVRYPGQGMFAKQMENLENGVPVEPELWRMIQGL